MEAKEIIAKLRQTFNELVNNAAAPVVPAEPMAPEMIMPTKAKLVDGTEIEVTEMGVGGIVTINGTPAPVGDLQLEDGTILTVGDNGAITVIEPSAPMTEDMAKKMKMEEIFGAFQTSTNQKFSDYEGKFAAYETRFADYEAKLSKATQVIEGLLNLTQTLAETPTGVPDASVKSSANFKQEKKQSYDLLFS
jgi:spore coat protein CotH